MFSALCVTARRLGFPPGLPVCLSVNIGAFGALQHAPEPCLSSVSAARASEPNRCFLIRGLGGVPLSKTPLGHSRAYFRRHVWNAAPDADTARQSGAAFLGRRLSGSLTRRLPCTLPGLSLSLCWAGSWPKCTRRVKTCRAAWTQTSTSSAAPRDCGVSSGGRGEEGAHRRVFSPDSSSFLSRPLRHGDV